MDNMISLFDIDALEKVKNRTNTLNEKSSDAEYPSAKAVYDAIRNNITETIIKNDSNSTSKVVHSDSELDNTINEWYSNMSDNSIRNFLIGSARAKDDTTTNLSIGWGNHQLEIRKFDKDYGVIYDSHYGTGDKRRVRYGGKWYDWESDSHMGGLEECSKELFNWKNVYSVTMNSGIKKNDTLKQFEYETTISYDDAATIFLRPIRAEVMCFKCYADSAETISSTVANKAVDHVKAIMIDPSQYTVTLKLIKDDENRKAKVQIKFDATAFVEANPDTNFGYFTGRVYYTRQEIETFFK